MGRFLEGIRFIFRDLQSDGWRSSITVINLVIFISCYFCLASLAEAGYKFGNQPRDPDELMMITHSVFDLSDSQITDIDFEPIRELIPSQVKSVSPLILKHLNIGGYFLQVRAAPLKDFEVVHKLSLLEGKWPTGTNDVVIGEGTRSLTNWKVGDKIRIYGVDFMITGLVHSTGTKFGSVWMSLENAEKLFNTHGMYQFAWIVLSPGADSLAVISQLSHDPRLVGKFDVYYADQLYQQYSSALNDVRDISLVLVILALLSVMFGVYGSTYLTLTERKRELTILRSVGFASRTIRLVLSMRTIIQVILAYLFSWVITLLAISWFESISPIMIHSIPLPVIISAKILFIGAFLSILFAWIGVWLPTRHLQKSSVISMIQR
jgi:ABC-type lipoprotein release transport system permease subunit